MAFYTDRDNAKPMLAGIALVVMVMFSQFTAETFLRGNSWHFACGYSILYGCLGFAIHGVIVSVSSRCSPPRCFPDITLGVDSFSPLASLALLVVAQVQLAGFFTFGPRGGSLALWGLSVFFHNSFRRIAFSANSYARFADIGVSASVPCAFAKLGKFFSLLARIASSRYNLLRHGFSLIKKLCLEPLQTTYLCGFSYYNRYLYYVKENF